MAATHKARGTAKRPSFDTPEGPSGPSTPRPGSKRLFSNRDSQPQGLPQGRDENDRSDLAETTDGDSHWGKRSRSNDWPLPKVASGEAIRRSPGSPSSVVAPLQATRGANASTTPRRDWSPVRSSRFIEGSMNKNKRSQRPPVEFTGPEGTLHESHQWHARRGSRDVSSRTPAPAPGGDTARHSGIYRLGKSVAASSFNPYNWRLWPKQPQPEDDTHEQDLRARREKAERIYRELKHAGDFRESAIRPKFPFAFAQDEEDVSASKHDSGVAFDDDEPEPEPTPGSSDLTAMQRKRMGRVFLDAPALPPTAASEPPPRIAIKRRSVPTARPRSRAGSGASTRTTTTDEPPTNRPRRPSLPDAAAAGHAARLVKRVSNLELQLEAARRELALASAGEAGEEARAQRPRFVPGALATLPSERLLSAYVSPSPEPEGEGEEGGVVEEGEIGRAVTTMEGAKGGEGEGEGEEFKWPDYVF